jgi:hypothetical protein
MIRATQSTGVVPTVFDGDEAIVAILGIAARSGVAIRTHGYHT